MRLRINVRRADGHARRLASADADATAAKAAALPEARRRRPEQQEGSGSHPAEADRRGSSGAEGPTIITDFVDRRGGSSRQTGFTGHTTHENACDRRPQENRCPSHKQIFSTNPPRALGAGRGGELYPPCRSLISEQNQKPTLLVTRASPDVGCMIPADGWLPETNNQEHKTQEAGLCRVWSKEGSAPQMSAPCD